jgi:hypothetical protein
VREERIARKGNRGKSTAKIVAITAIGIMAFVMLDISTLQEIKAQPIFPSSQQITKTPASHIHQLPQQKRSTSICNPNDTFVNVSESKICGIPATIKSNNTSTASTDRTYIPGRGRVCELMIVGEISHQK